MKAPLLVELQVEELPPKSLQTLGDSFATLLAAALVAEGLAAADAAVAAFATPRRLAVRVAGVLAQAPDRPLRQKLMPVGVGLDAEGRATPALVRKLDSLGLDAGVVPALRRVAEGRNEVLVLDTVRAGATLAAGLHNALAEALARLPISKVMSYQLDDGWSSVHFVRPAHRLVALHGAAVVPVSVLGLRAGRTTHGHRFEAARTPIELVDADGYEMQLAREGAVIAGFGERRAEIGRQLAQAAAREGLVPIDDPALLDEVTGLVERPNVLVCRFEPEYLAVPQECLVLTMKANQKYFPLLTAAGKLSNVFLVVANIRPDDPSRIVEGNERVVRPRLADAKFFYDQDRRQPLAARAAGLAKVVYHGKLGTQAERVERVRAIARAIVDALPGAADPAAFAAEVDLAAQLAKADLLTEMVGEFPELQGIMGAYYARHDGLPAAVADAIEDHYKPRFAGDALPRAAVGRVVALADKLETLAGMFGIGQLPTGDKDPFALRRHAFGVVRLLVEERLPLSVPALVSKAFAAFGPAHGQAQAELLRFLDDRLAGYLREQGAAAPEVDAVIALHPDRWDDVPARLAAVREFARLPEAPALAAANKRVANILKKSESAAGAIVDPALYVEPAERELDEALRAATAAADPLYERGDFAASLQALAALKAPVDAYFDRVMVNADDPRLRANRLALLARLHRALNRVADLSSLSRG
jgi:glycyl-tRNA synthetase beta chain